MEEMQEDKDALRRNIEQIGGVVASEVVPREVYPSHTP
jgi:hypothetical protein